MTTRGDREPHSECKCNEPPSTSTKSSPGPISGNSPRNLPRVFPVPSLTMRFGPCAPWSPCGPVLPCWFQEIFFQPFLHFFLLPERMRTSPVFFLTQALTVLAWAGMAVPPATSRPAPRAPAIPIRETLLNKTHLHSVWWKASGSGAARRDGRRAAVRDSSMPPPWPLGGPCGHCDRRRRRRHRRSPSPGRRTSTTRSASTCRDGRRRPPGVRAPDPLRGCGPLPRRPEDGDPLGQGRQLSCVKTLGGRRRSSPARSTRCSEARCPPRARGQRPGRSRPTDAWRRTLASDHLQRAGPICRGRHFGEEHPVSREVRRGRARPRAVPVPVLAVDHRRHRA